MGAKEDLQRFYVRKYSASHPVVLYLCTIGLACIAVIGFSLPTWFIVLVLGGLLGWTLTIPEGSMMLDIKDSEVSFISGNPKGGRSSDKFKQTEFQKIGEWRNWMRLRHPAYGRSFFVYRNWNKDRAKFKLVFLDGRLLPEEIPA